MENNQSKFINMQIKDRIVLIPNWYSVSAIKEYFSSYKKDKNYRKAFCNLIFVMINSKSFNENLDDIILKDVESISDNNLIKIMKAYLDKYVKLNNYFQIKFNDDHFQTFYLANDAQLNEIKKRIANNINNIVPISQIYKQITPIYLKYKPPMQNIISLMQSTRSIFPTESMVKLISPKPIIDFYKINNALINFQKNIKLAIEPFVIKIARLQSSYKSVLPNFSKQFIEIVEKLKKFNKEIEQFKRIIIMLGFPPHLTLMPYEISRIVSAYNSYGEEKARRVTYDIYMKHFNNEMIKEIGDKWYDINILSNRKNIIKQAVIAHLHKEYYLSIPIVFSQIEGLIANVFHHKGQMYGKVYLKYVNKLLDDKKDYSFDCLISQFYSKIILVTFHHNEPIGSVLSRHAILHGGDTEYGTKINSIKALLLFDYMVDKMSEYVNKENKLLDKSS